ncbi:MAG TPA: hypothetical protein VK689_02335, partial [Armatimonadota bacterium]|nr:hypothetical protein [Armatimonadota bacterium]
MIIVNRSASPFGVGWWLAGVEQLIDVPGDTLKLWIGGDGSARLYRGTSSAGPWAADGYERPDSIHKTASGHYVRTLPGRSQIWFDPLGRHVRTVNPLQQYTEFQWVNNHLQQIVTPYGSGANDVARYGFEYNLTSPDTVRRLRLVTAPAIAGTPRDTRLQGDGMGRVTAIMDTDTVRFAYASGNRWMGQRMDRRGATHNFSYVSGRFHTSTRKLNATQNAVSRVQAVQTLGMLGRSVRADSVRGGWDGPRTEFCDCSVWGVDRWGAPTYVRDAYGQVTTIRRNDIRFPALVTETNAPNGFATTAAYDARGNLASTTAWNPYGDQRNATTTYRWHPYWDKPVQVVAPEGEISLTAYDTVTGQRLWEQVGPHESRRVTYGYYPATRQVQSVTAPGGGTETYTYDARGNLRTVTSPLQVTTEMLRDPLGRVVRTSVPAAVTASGVIYQQDSVVYDVMDQVRETIVTGPAMNGVGQQRLHVRNEYDKEGNLTQVERWSVPDSANVHIITTRWEYDLGGRPIVEIAPDSTPGNPRDSTFYHLADNPRDSTFYDLAGNVVRVRTRRYAESLAAAPSHPDSAYVRMQYDAMNRLTHRIFPAVQFASRFTTIGIKHQSYSGFRIPADTAIFVYNLATGLQERADNANAQVRRLYYPNGQLQYDSLYTREVATASFNTHRYGLEYRYDRAGRTTSLLHPAQLRPPLAAAQGWTGNQFTYDPLTGALSTVTDPMGNPFRYYYNVRGEPDSLVLPGGITHRYSYNNGGQLQGHDIYNPATSGNRYPLNWLHRATLEYELRGKLRQFGNRDWLADTLKVQYSGLGHMARSTHSYRGRYTDTDQHARHVA